MACCYRRNSTIHYCHPCIDIVCADGYGRCPSCRAYFTVSPDGIVSVVDHVDVCRVCRQTRVIIDEEKKICEPCLLGQRYCFKYSCKECRNGQFIPHPMWTYQETPFTYTSVTWACQQCQSQTKWKIYAYMINSVPLQHVPESWGGQEEYLAQIRAERPKNCSRQIEKVLSNNAFNSLVLTPVPMIVCWKILESFGARGLLYIVLYISFLAILRHLRMLDGDDKSKLKMKMFVLRVVVPCCSFLVARYWSS